MQWLDNGFFCVFWIVFLRFFADRRRGRRTDEQRERKEIRGLRADHVSPVPRPHRIPDRGHVPGGESAAAAAADRRRGRRRPARTLNVRCIRICDTTLSVSHSFRGIIIFISRLTIPAVAVQHVHRMIFRLRRRSFCGINVFFLNVFDFFLCLNTRLKRFLEQAYDSFRFIQLRIISN